MLIGLMRAGIEIQKRPNINYESVLNYVNKIEKDTSQKLGIESKITMLRKIVPTDSFEQSNNRKKNSLPYCTDRLWQDFNSILVC